MTHRSAKQPNGYSPRARSEELANRFELTGRDRVALHEALWRAYENGRLRGTQDAFGRRCRACGKRNNDHFDADGPRDVCLQCALELSVGKAASSDY